MKDWRNCDAVERHLDKVSGAWVFRGTPVPVSALFENLKSGVSIEQFLEWFPGVERSQVEAILDFEVMTLTDPAIISDVLENRNATFSEITLR
ncbi:MAG: DUF433 domain-containing protein [candidate division KSB1 bacterium]|nr:DUF433 domain-containing protein [candidate division KSB1 bacterium]MDZ7367908.1 DUF433 domain-containing protein [candidate division KSB1 bacterium]MDZ7406525.1 DUF433 domain-containing protein [candidate division KSB1 bacterium]